MTEWDKGLLNSRVREFVADYLGDPHLIADMSWGQVDTIVLRVRSDGREFVVKTAGSANHHIGREITAHEGFTAPLVRSGHTGPLIAADRERNALITAYQPGILMQDSPHELDRNLHAQAGSILRTFHDQFARADPEYERRVTDKSLAALDRPHRIKRSAEAEARRLLSHYVPGPTTVVPTHGDWQPRNWLVDNGQLRVIDFGRFDFRPAATDLCRLAVQQWQTSPELEAAFVDGYGSDPRNPDVWRIDQLREAVNTAVWAYQVRDHAFEAQGHQMLDQALAQFA